MVVIQLNGGFGRWLKYRPGILHRMNFCDLQSRTVLGDSYIQAVVVIKCPLQDHTKSYLQKLVIKEILNEDPDDVQIGTVKMSVFLFGNQCKQFAAVAVGDYICMTDVWVEQFSGFFRIVIKENVDRPPRIWLMKSSSSSPSAPKHGTSIPPKRRIRNPENYAYTALKDLKPHTTTNVWGVIKFHKPKIQSRGLDFAQTLSIVDQSLSGREKLVCVLFAATTSVLPDLKGVGQIVRLHRIQVQTKLNAKSGFGFSWLLFDAALDAPTEPLSSGSSNYTFDESDTNKLIELRRWVRTNECRSLLNDISPVAKTRAGVDINLNISIPDPQTQPQPSTSAVINQPLPNVPRYLKLSNVAFTDIVNVLGVIVFSARIKDTVTAQYMKSLSIMDQSNKTLKCTLFANNRSDLPEQALIGQLISFHNLKIDNFNRTLQGKRSPGFKWGLFDAPQKGVPELVTSSDSQHSTDATEMTALCEWAEKNNLLRYKRNTCLADIEHNAYFNLVCQVVLVVQKTKESIALRVWDGTKPSIDLLEALLEGTMMAMDALVGKSLGKCVDVFIYDDHVDSAQNIKEGDFIALTNLHAMRLRDSEDYEMCMHRGTSYSRGLCILNSQSDIMVARVKEQMRAAEQNNTNPGPSTTNGVTPSKIIRLSQAAQQSNADPEASTSNNHRQVTTRRSPGQSPTDRKRTSEDSLRNGQQSQSMRESATVLEPEPSTSNKHESNQSATDHRHRSYSDGQLRCMQHSATVTVGHHHIGFTKIGDLLDDQPPAKYRIRVQLIDYRPHADSFDSIYCTYCSVCHDMKTCSGAIPTEECTEVCTLCEEAENEVERVVRFELTVADETGILQLHLWGCEAEIFFTDTIDLLTPLGSKKVHDVLETLSKVDMEADVGAADIHWLECCIASYTINGKTYFHIFDTMLATNID